MLLVSILYSNFVSNKKVAIFNPFYVVIKYQCR